MLGRIGGAGAHSTWRHRVVVEQDFDRGVDRLFQVSLGKRIRLKVVEGRESRVVGAEIADAVSKRFFWNKVLVVNIFENQLDFVSTRPLYLSKREDRRFKGER